MFELLPVVRVPVQVVVSSSKTATATAATATTTTATTTTTFPAIGSIINIGVKRIARSGQSTVRGIVTLRDLLVFRGRRGGQLLISVRMPVHDIDEVREWLCDRVPACLATCNSAVLFTYLWHRPNKTK